MGTLWWIGVMTAIPPYAALLKPAGTMTQAMGLAVQLSGLLMLIFDLINRLVNGCP